MLRDQTEWTSLLEYDFQVRSLGERSWYARDVKELGAHDIKRVLYAYEGINEGDDWLMLCELKSGEFMHLFANCCYTGFEVSGHVYCFVAQTIKQLRSGGIRDIDVLRYMTNKRIVSTVQELVDNAVRPRT